MSRMFRSLLLSACALAGPSCLAAGAPPVEKPRQQFIALHVSVNALGKVQSSAPMDIHALPALNQAAAEIARKLTFTPARKDGRPVSSETTLSLTLELKPRASGGYGLALKRAQNGPGLLAVGKANTKGIPTEKENGALVVVGVDLRADGTVIVDTMKRERADLRVPSSYAEARYLSAISKTLADTRFQLDKVDGVEIPARISAPFRFGGGPAAVKPGDDDGEKRHKAPEDMDLPSLNPVSLIPGIEFAKIQYPIPAKP